MLKILSANKTKELDQFTITHEPIAPIDLMERACHAFVDWYVSHFRKDKIIGIVCGPGNNGGDGLGIARLLNDRNYRVKVWIVTGGQKESESFKTNRDRLQRKIDLFEISNDADEILFNDTDVLIDALFGSGLSRPVEGIFAAVISKINQASSICIAVDIPSGLLADDHTNGDAVRAHHTVTFQLPKLAFLLPENHRWVGQWHVVDIGLSEEFIKKAASPNYLTTEKSVKRIIRPRDQFSHKGNYGHALLISGSFGKMGACILSAKAAIHSGLGLLTVHTPSCGYSIIQTAVPEAMVTVDVSENYFSSPPESLNYSAVGIGPGIGTNSETVKALAKILKEYKRPMVIDADALNITASHRELLQLIPEGSILTPHPKEFERLAGSWANDFERLDMLRKFSAKLKSVIILKGAYSAISFPDGNVHFNPTGNPGMAKGGSGDVLTGILTGLLAQGYSSGETAMLGVYLHGLAGDLVANESGMDSMSAGDIISQLPGSFKKLRVCNDLQ